jgi:hypothetical protein
MADAKVDSELIVLWCGRFGLGTDWELPTGGFLGGSHNNVATPAYPIGHVKYVYNQPGYGKEGMSEFVYLQYVAATTTITTKAFCIPASASTWYQVTADPDQTVGDETGCPLAVAPICSMTDTYYGWFWSGGIVPEAFVAAFAGDWSTEGSVIGGAIIADNLTTDMIGLGPCAADTEAIIGHCINTDS